MFLIAGILLFILLIVLHEYGHFLVAKRNGVEVEEFGIFFPPKLAGKKMGKGIFESYYTINLLPLGGFVKLKGENNQDTRKGSFGAASFRTKAKVTLAGVITNYVIGVFLMMLIAFFGIPKFFDNQWFVASDVTLGETIVYVDNLAEGLPAKQAGLGSKDIINTFDGVQLTDTDQFVELISSNKGEAVELEYKDFSDNDVVKTTILNIRADNDDEQGFIGAGIGDGRTSFDQLDYPLWAAPVNGFLLANQLALETVKAIGGALGSVFDGDTAAAGESVSGPVGVVDFLANDVNDMKGLMIIIANLSIALAVANLLPIPGLDGGRFYTILAFRLMNKELTEETEQKINAVGVIILLTLVVLITINDINKL